MSDINIPYTLELTGTFVFAISGALTAAEKKFDVFGAAIIAFVTAVGGGTIRDLLINSHPVGWMNDLNHLYLIGSGVVVSFFFKDLLQRVRKTLFLFDAIGIGLFTILGLQKTLDHGLDPLIAIMMGTVSAVFGGVVRDVLCNEIPLIFRKEIYATACMAGAILYFILSEITGIQAATFISIAFIIVIRILAVKRNWSLPVFPN